MDEKKGLDLRQFKVEPDSEVKDRDGIVYPLTSQIPMSTTEKFFDLNIDAKKFSKDDVVIMKTIVKEILLVKNEEVKVDALMEKLSQDDFIAIVEYISEWMNQIRESKQKKS